MRVVIADDAVLFREGLARVLADGGFDVVGQAGDADELRAAVRRARPELAIVDVRMPPTQTDEGARAAREIRAEQPDVAVLVLSQTVEVQHAFELFSERPEGFGYLLKDRVLDVRDFYESVRRVGRGGTRRRCRGGRAAHGPSPRAGSAAELTPREREVLALMAEGVSNAGIAGRLVLSPKTVESHVNAIFRKLGLVDEPDEHRRVLAVLRFLRAH